MMNRLLAPIGHARRSTTCIQYSVGGRRRDPTGVGPPSRSDVLGDQALVVSAGASMPDSNRFDTTTAPSTTTSATPATR